MCTSLFVQMSLNISRDGITLLCDSDAKLGSWLQVVSRVAVVCVLTRPDILSSLATLTGQLLKISQQCL